MTEEQLQIAQQEARERAGVAEGQFYFVRNSRGSVIDVGVFEKDAKMPPLRVREPAIVGSILLNSSRMIVPVGRTVAAPGDTIQINLSVNS